MSVTSVAGDIISPRVITITDAMDLREVARILVEKGITGAPVVDADRQIRRHSDLTRCVAVGGRAAMRWCAP